MVHLGNGILLDHQKGWCNAVCSDMDGSRVCHTERSKSDTEKQIHDITYMWNLKLKDTNELIYKTEVESKILKTNLWLSEDGVGEIVRRLGLMYTPYSTYRISN